MPNAPDIPEPFLEVRVHDFQTSPGITGLCAGYEAGDWRAAQLARHIVEWLPDFALSQRERDSLGTGNMMRLAARAAEVIYNTRTADPNDLNSRGEIGEILLHCAIRQVFNSIPAISKFYFKDAANDTVKGFDAVHVVATKDLLELWLGEVKFYTDVSRAIADVVKELAKHTERDYLRSEFASIVNKIDDAWPHADRLKKLIDRNTSLDEIFDAMTIPVFLTYESKVVNSHTVVCKGFVKDFEVEVKKYHGIFTGKSLPDRCRIHLFLLPMKLKQEIVASFDERLRACQLLGN